MLLDSRHVEVGPRAVDAQVHDGRKPRRDADQVGKSGVGRPRPAHRVRRRALASPVNRTRGLEHVELPPLRDLDVLPEPAAGDSCERARRAADPREDVVPRWSVVAAVAVLGELVDNQEEDVVVEEGHVAEREELLDRRGQAVLPRPPS